VADLRSFDRDRRSPALPVLPLRVRSHTACWARRAAVVGRLVLTLLVLGTLFAPPAVQGDGGNIVGGRKADGSGTGGTGGIGGSGTGGPVGGGNPEEGGSNPGVANPSPGGNPFREVIRQATKEIEVLGYVVTVGEAALIMLTIAGIAVSIWAARRPNQR
jgi:hypothetical protein